MCLLATFYNTDNATVFMWHQELLTDQNHREILQISQNVTFKHSLLFAILVILSKESLLIPRSYHMHRYWVRMNSTCWFTNVKLEANGRESHNVNIFETQTKNRHSLENYVYFKILVFMTKTMFSLKFKLMSLDSPKSNQMASSLGWICVVKITFL